MIHVFPVDDLKKHKLEGTNCECNPKIIMENNQGIVVHNSFDFREAVEEALEIINQPKNEK